MSSDCKLLIYDGDCGLCHWAVGFLVKRLNKEKSCMYFVSSVSEVGDFLLKKHCFDPSNLDSLVVLKEDEILLRSMAVKSSLQECRGLWPFLGGLVGVLPGGDYLYNKVAQNRQKLMTKDGCSFDPDFAKISINTFEELKAVGRGDQL